MWQSDILNASTAELSPVNEHCLNEGIQVVKLQKPLAGI